MIETLKGYCHAKEDIKKGHLLAIMQNEKEEYVVISCVESCRNCGKEGHSGCNMNVYSEQFQLLFHEVLTKFVAEYDDMAYMSAINKAKELLDIINETN